MLVYSAFVDVVAIATSTIELLWLPAKCGISTCAAFALLSANIGRQLCLKITFSSAAIQVFNCQKCQVGVGEEKEKLQRVLVMWRHASISQIQIFGSKANRNHTGLVSTQLRQISPIYVYLVR